MKRFAEFRLDASTLKDLPDGGIRVQAQLTHPGIFNYRNPDGSLRREYRPAEEVFKKDALDTFAGATVTVNHPRQPDGQRLVTAQSWKKDAIGHVGENIRQDGEHVVADLFVRDAAAVAQIRAGNMRHISCGYEVDYDPTPGTAPDGTRYDGVQRNMRGNHVAILPNGVAPRGGSECVLRLDANGDELNWDVDIEALKAKVAALEGELAKARTDAADVPKLKTQLAEANAEIARLGEQVKPARLDSLVEERSGVLEAAKTAGVETKGKSNLDIKRAIVAKRTPALAARVDSMDANAVDAVMAVYAEQPHPSMAVLGTDPTRGTRADDAGDSSARVDTASIPKVGDLHENFVKKSRDAWKAGGERVN